MAAFCFVYHGYLSENIMKKCSCCRIEKPFTEYHKNKSGKSGYANYCIQCKRLTRKKPDSKQRFKKFKETNNRWIVYEFYDLNNNCIYIGQSKVFDKRFIQHNYTSIFSEEINIIVCYIMESFPDMAFMEAQLIIQKQPKYNDRIIESKASKFTVEYVDKVEYNVHGIKIN